MNSLWFDIYAVERRKEGRKLFPKMKSGLYFEHVAIMPK
jgi:hypothetical protein